MSLFGHVNNVEFQEKNNRKKRCKCNCWSDKRFQIKIASSNRWIYKRNLFEIAWNGIAIHRRMEKLLLLNNNLYYVKYGLNGSFSFNFNSKDDRSFVTGDRHWMKCISMWKERRKRDHKLKMKNVQENVQKNHSYISSDFEISRKFHYIFFIKILILFWAHFIPFSHCSIQFIY